MEAIESKLQQLSEKHEGLEAEQARQKEYLKDVTERIDELEKFKERTEASKRRRNVVLYGLKCWLFFMPFFHLILFRFSRVQPYF